MKPKLEKPYLYYSVVELADGSGPFFLERNESFDCEFKAFYNYDGLILGATAVKTIWYDFEKETFYKSEVELDPLQIYGGVSVMLVMGGSIVIWVATPAGCETIANMECQAYEINDINPEWDSQRIKLLKSYNRNRKDLRDDIGKTLMLLQSQMRRYKYRYNFIVYGEEELDLTLIKELLIDGSLHNIKDDLFFNYYDRACPLKIELGWSIGDDNYSSFFFMQETEIIGFFNRFFGLHPDTKSDYIFYIDAENKKYELALYRQGLKEPVVIPQSAYQLIVFKNKFEDYRSENYNQPRGAWIW